MSDQSASTPSDRFKAERDRFVAMAFCWADVVMELDENEKIVFAAGPTEAWIGKKFTDLIGRSLADVVFAGDLSLVRGLLAIPRSSGRIEDATVRLQKSDGPTDPVWFAGYRLEDLGNHYFLSLRSSPSAAGARRDDPNRDAETGLQDVDAFADKVKKAVESGEAGEDTLMTLISLPGFEGLRGRLDDDGEKQLLNTLGTYLNASSVGGDMATRVGDDKFGLVHAKNLDVGAVEEQLSQFSKEADPTGEGVEIQAATLDMARDDVSQQDIASGLSYTLKKFQKSAEADFDLSNLQESFSSLVSETADRVREFRSLVAAADFDVAFHPILHSATGEIHHYEALVRFKKDGNKSPFETITFAEESGLIPEFDLAMATKVVNLLANIPDRYHAAVNISGNSIGDETYVKGLHALLNNNEWAAERIIFEITESARMADLDAANEFIQGLRKNGYEVCLDDFGAGAASFQYLSVLEVDVVKLDGSAIQNAQKAAKGKAFLKALARFCREMGVQTIGEMVDSPEGLAFVRDCGVQYVQGFLFGEPNTNILSFKLDKKQEALFRKTGGRRAFG